MMVSVNVRKSFIFTENEDWKYPVISYFTTYEKVQYYMKTDLYYLKMCIINLKVYIYKAF